MRPSSARPVTCSGSGAGAPVLSASIQMSPAFGISMVSVPGMSTMRWLSSSPTLLPPETMSAGTASGATVEVFRSWM